MLVKGQDMMAHACNPNAQEAEKDHLSEASLGFSYVLGQPGLRLAQLVDYLPSLQKMPVFSSQHHWEAGRVAPLCNPGLRK